MSKQFLFTLILALFTLIALPTAAHASVKDVKEPLSHHAIHTYGGGDLFEKIFRSVSMLIYGNTESGIGKTFNGIVRIALTIGGFCAICLAFFRESFEPLIRNFFLPGLGIISFLLVPRTTVYIQDHLVQYSISTDSSSLKKVEDVPFFLGKLATLVSSVSYELTNAFEHVAHGVNDDVYNWTGHIYAGENIFRTQKCRIANPVVEDNFREFCRECVFRDIGIGLYSKDDLVKTPSLLTFLENNTSKVRTVIYKELPPPSTTTTDITSLEGSFISCHEAIHRINLLLDKKEGNAAEMLFGELGNEMQFLLNQKEVGGKDLKNLIKQQMAIQTLKEELPGTMSSFAAKRAELLQKENQKILGALGASSIVAMRNFFEAVIYMVFPIMILVSLMSFGIQPLIHWVHFALWVNIWPPFYVVVNFLLNAIWAFRKKLIWGEGLSLTLFSSEGLADLYSSMESIAAIAMAFIPFLSWILLKGGVSQMVQLASSLMSPAQSAASTAASEQTYGNYSYGNVNLESLSGYNAQTFRQTYSGSLSYGSYGIDTGTQTITYSPDQGELFLKQGDSYLREGISRTEAFNHSLQDSLSSSQMAVMESSKSVSAGITDTANKGVGLMQAISRHEQFGENFNAQEMTSTQRAFHSVMSIADEYAKANGMSNDAAVRELFSTGVSGGLASKLIGLKGDVQASFQDGVSKFSSDTSFERVSNSSNFQDHIQTIKNLSKGEVASILGSEDAKLHEDFVQSLSKTESSMDQWRASYSQQQSMSELQSYAESTNLSIHQNLNQRFVDFLKDKYHGDIGKISDATELTNTNPEKRALIDEFVHDYLPAKISSDPMTDWHERNVQALPGFSEENFQQNKTDLIQQGESKIGHRFGQAKEMANQLQSQVVAGERADKSRLDNERKELETGKSQSVQSSVKDAIHTQSFGTYAKEKMATPIPGYTLLMVEKLLGRAPTQNSEQGKTNDRN